MSRIPFIAENHFKILAYACELVYLLPEPFGICSQVLHNQCIGASESRTNFEKRCSPSSATAPSVRGAKKEDPVG
jgi:hypothetical protein